jgi:selenocysteine lyase/cysteine desulfurase
VAISFPGSIVQTGPRVKTHGAKLRSLFPALGQVTYLNTPTAAAAALPVLESVREAEDRWASGRFDWLAWEAEAEATRGLFARLIGGRPGEVALLTSVAEAASTVAAGLPRGRVVVGEREFRSNLFPWLALARRGFEVVEVGAEDGVVSTDRLCAAITPGTVLAAVTEVQSASGFRVRLPEIGARCRETGTRLFVNLTQSLGALRFDAEACGADYVASHGYKWLLAPRGATWLWVRPERLAELEPLCPSWKSVDSPFSDFYGGPAAFAAGARRLDGSLAWFSWVGARAALELLAGLDAAEVEARCIGLARAFREAAAERGFRLLPSEMPSQTAAIHVPDPEALRGKLAERRVVAAVRGGSLRLGFHAYNDESDLAAVLEALDASGR